MSKLLVTVLTAVLLSACSVLPTAKSSPMATYTLSPIVSQVTAATAKCSAVLRVRSVQATSPWSSDGLVYSESDYRIATFAYHKWAAPPAEMLTGALVRAVATSGHYRGVLGPTDPGDASLTLAVRLVSGPLQTFSGSSAGEEAAARSSRESLALAATLAATSSGTLVASKEFADEIPAKPNPYGGVEAANKLAGQLITEIVTWLGEQAAGDVCKNG